VDGRWVVPLRWLKGNILIDGLEEEGIMVEQTYDVLERNNVYR
jgi:hypothetical protein